MFWQEVLPPDCATLPPFVDRFPARLPDGRVLFLPIRSLGDTGTGIASLILNQTAFAVEAILADALAEALRDSAPEVIVGLPTLGLSLARGVAQRLGHDRYVALGTSRKFWYDDALSVPMRSITSPGAEKTLYLDPRMRPVLQGRRLCLIDDVISTGTSMGAGLTLLNKAGFAPVAVGAAMLQTRRWVAHLVQVSSLGPDQIKGVLHTPLLQSAPDGWHPA